jgi:glycine betaine/proline transport system ATP-binding protein
VSAPVIALDGVSIVFGDRPDRALPAMDRGLDREAVRAETGLTFGVHDASLEVAEGEIVVLMGLSGSGKSTLLRAVNGLLPVARGTVRLRGPDGPVEVQAAGAEALRALRRSTVSMVFQQFGLLPWRTVRDNVGLGLELSGVPRAARAARVEAQLDLVGLSDWSGRMVGELSGGMQQRVGLARALATEAPILLMDEPFSALDPLIRDRLQGELMALQARLRRTILFVSHDLEEAFRIGSRIAIMEGGRIIQIGTPAEIAAAPATAHVAEFVGHMNPLGALTVGDAMEAAVADPDAPALPHDAPLADALSLLATHDTATVIRDGTARGRVTRAGLIRALAARQPSA